MKVDLTNRKFGFLKALYPTTKRVQRKVVWRCECVCGKECEVLSTNLTSGRTVSCGCKKYEIVSKHYRDKSPKQGEIINGTKIVDTDYRPDNRGFNECYVLAECKFCGKEFWVRKASLENGNTKSCGCTRNSTGEATIQKILDENSIAYEREKIFKIVILKIFKTNADLIFTLRTHICWNLMEYNILMSMNVVKVLGSMKKF